MLDSSTSVLIIRLDAIGDALALTPLLAAFRERGIPVDLVASERNAGIFSQRAARAIFVAPFELRSSGRQNLEAIRRFGAEIAHRTYTHVLVATEDPGGYRLARDTHAPHRIGFANTWGKPFKRLWVSGLLTQTVERTAGLDARAPHECEVLFALGRSILGGDVGPSRSAAVLRELVIDAQPPHDDRVLFQITDKWRRLGVADDDVIAAIAATRDAGYRLRCICSRSELTYAKKLAVRAGCQVESFGELGSWKDSIATARAVIAPDSGAVHLAGMIGTPVVAVFPASRDFARQAARWAPWAAPNYVLEATAGWPTRATDALKKLIPIRAIIDGDRDFR